jgi:hypothetical protein
MSDIGTIIEYGNYAYRVYALIVRGNPEHYEGWYEVWTPERDKLIRQTALFDPGERAPHVFPSDTQCRDAALIEAKWQIRHMIPGRTASDHQGRWRQTWQTRGDLMECQDASRRLHQPVSAPIQI